MASKKLPGRFTLQFNTADPHHRVVIDILNQQGRSKSQFITSAVLHYINCPETPEYQAPTPVFNVEELERLVADIISRKSNLSPAPEVNSQIPEKLPPEVTPNPFLHGNSILDHEDLAAIAHSLAAFRSE